MVCLPPVLSVVDPASIQLLANAEVIKPLIPSHTAWVNHVHEVIIWHILVFSIPHDMNCLCCRLINSLLPELHWKVCFDESGLGLGQGGLQAWCAVGSIRFDERDTIPHTCLVSSLYIHIIPDQPHNLLKPGCTYNHKNVQSNLCAVKLVMWDHCDKRPTSNDRPLW